jgi:hypothetical protein
MGSLLHTVDGSCMAAKAEGASGKTGGEDARSTKLVFVSVRGKHGRRRKAVGMQEGATVEQLRELVREKHSLHELSSLVHASSGEPVRDSSELADAEDLIAEAPPYSPADVDTPPPPSTPPSHSARGSSHSAPSPSQQQREHHFVGQDAKAKRGELPFTTRDDRRKRRSPLLLLRSKQRLVVATSAGMLCVFAFAAYALHSRLSGARGP